MESLKSTLSAMTSTALDAFKALVIACVEGHEPDPGEIYDTLRAAGKTNEQLLAAVEYLNERKRASDRLEREAAVIAEIQQLEAQAAALVPSIEAAKAEAERIVNEALKPAQELRRRVNELEAERREIMRHGSSNFLAKEFRGPLRDKYDALSQQIQNIEAHHNNLGDVIRGERIESWDGNGGRKNAQYFEKEIARLETVLSRGPIDPNPAMNELREARNRLAFIRNAEQEQQALMAQRGKLLAAREAMLSKVSDWRYFSLN